MPRVSRIDKADLVYHITNRANGRQRIFSEDKDYLLFEHIVQEAQERTKMCIYSFSVMPNHWHFVISPRNDGDLGIFMRWLTLTHTQRHHAATKTIGGGHIYQGRYKSFIVSTDEHFLTLCRYVERNALRAGLVQRAEDWRWSSLWIRINAAEKAKKFLASWPVPESINYLSWINEQEEREIIDSIRSAIRRGNPFGRKEWAQKIVKQFSLESTFRTRGRPRKGT